jgi:hypothetical protein
MDTKQINTTFDLLSLVDGLRKAGKYHVGPCPFCGGEDRFTVKHTKDGDRWHCRQCGDGKYHTPIDFIMRRDDVDFKTAYKTLTGESPAPARRSLTPKARPIPKAIDLPSVEWQAKAIRHIDAASNSLFAPEAGQVGREALERRGLKRGTWYAWHLGFAFIYDPKAERKRPAIVIPWLDMGAGREVLTAVKYRFIDTDPNPDALRYVSLGGSKPLLFGLWDVIESDTMLLLVEGEINTLSVWQCRPRGVSVLSFGSEGGGDLHIIQAMAKHYDHIFVWADDVWDNSKQGMRAKELRALVKGRGLALRSVKQDGVKHDANELLMCGALNDFLTRILGVECLEYG